LAGYGEAFEQQGVFLGGIGVRVEARPDYLVLLLLLAWGIFWGHPAMAQARGALSVEDDLRTLEFAPLMGVALSPDSERLAYTVKNNQRSRTVDPESWARSGVRDAFTGTDIFLESVKTGAVRSLTGGEGDNFLPVWSPDGRYLAFLSNRDRRGQLRLWIWDLVHDEMRKLSDLNIRQFGQIEWTPDSQKLIVPVLPADLSPEEYAKRLTSSVSDQSASTGPRVPGPTVVFYQSSGERPDANQAPKSDPWNLDILLRDLVSIDVANGRGVTIVRGQRIASFLVSPDGSRIAYTVPKRFEKPGSQQLLFDLMVTSFSTGRQQVVASEIRLDYEGAPFAWSPDSRSLVYRNDGPQETTHDCFVAEAGASPRNVTSMTVPQDWPRSAPVWDKSGRGIYFVSNGALWGAGIDQGRAVQIAQIPNRQIMHLVLESDHLPWISDDGQWTIVLTHDPAGKQDGFYRVNLRTGGSARLLETGECYTCTNVEEDEFTVATRDRQHVFYFAEDAGHHADLWMNDPGFGNPRRLTRLNSQFDKYDMGSARLVDWLSDDGETLQGALLLPSGYEEGKRYPLIVWVYGGSSGSNDFDHFGLAGSGPFNMQMFATRGYAVLVPDAPERLGTPMVDLVKTVLPGVSKLVELGIADPERLGVMGHSYGGYSTLSLIVETNRFKAAVEADGMADLIGAYGQMDRSGAAFGTSFEGQGQILMGGTPWEFPERYIENSPVFHLDRVETPLMIIHGTQDTVVRSFLGDEVFVGLRRLGKEVQYGKYDGEQHSPENWSYLDQVDLCNRLIAWFDRYLKAGAP
jgi:dipeptidyl aminopeptidase/acylaminoacyl peptidase